MFLAFETFKHDLLLVEHTAIVSIKALQGYLDDGDNTSAVAGSVLELSNGKWQWVAAAPRDVVTMILDTKDAASPTAGATTDERAFYTDHWKDLPDPVKGALERSGQVVVPAQESKMEVSP